MFAIRWGDFYVRDLRSPRPYTKRAEEAQTWCTRRAANRWLALKDQSYAASCVVVEVPD